MDQAARAAGGSLDTSTVLTVVGLYVLVWLCHAAHNITYFNLVGSPSGTPPVTSLFSPSLQPIPASLD